MKKALLLIISSLYFSYAVAQVTVEAAIDSIEMLIGEQVHVTVNRVISIFWRKQGCFRRFCCCQMRISWGK